MRTPLTLHSNVLSLPVEFSSPVIVVGTRHSGRAIESDSNARWTLICTLGNDTAAAAAAEVQQFEAFGQGDACFKIAAGSGSDTDAVSFRFRDLQAWYLPPTNMQQRCEYPLSFLRSIGVRVVFENSRIAGFGSGMHYCAQRDTDDVASDPGRYEYFIRGGCIGVKDAPVELYGVELKLCSGTNGGAVYSDAGQLVMVDTNVTDSVATERGGGVAVSAGTVVIRGGKLERNVVIRFELNTLTGTRFGGGLSCFGAPHMAITGTRFSFNEVMERYAGGPRGEDVQDKSANLHLGGGMSIEFCDSDINGLTLDYNGAGTVGDRCGTWMVFVAKPRFVPRPTSLISLSFLFFFSSLLFFLLSLFVSFLYLCCPYRLWRRHLCATQHCKLS